MARDNITIDFGNPVKVFRFSEVQISDFSTDQQFQLLGQYMNYYVDNYDRARLSFEAWFSETYSVTWYHDSGKPSIMIDRTNIVRRSNMFVNE